MDFVTFKAQIEAAHQAEAQAAGATFKLRLPSEHTWRVMIEGHRDSEGRVLEALAFRSVLNSAVIGWEGVKTTHILPEAPDEALPFTPAARSELLDARQDIADEITIALALKMRERREKREAARKN